MSAWTTIRDAAGAAITLGRKTKAGSLPVTIASDQDAIPVAVQGNITLGSSVAVSNFPATQPISATGLPLPTGASTETTLAALNTKVPAQGQALAGASVPVVLPAAQVTTLTPPAAISNYATETGGNLATLAGAIAAGAMKAVLQAGSAIIGKVGIDQTTPGTTNGVVVNSSALPTGAALDGTLTGGTQQTRITDGTTVANVLAIASGQNAQAVAGGFKEMASLSAGSLNADLLPSTDVSAYKEWSLHIGSNAYSGTLTFQGSNDGTNFVSVPAIANTNLATLFQLSASSTGILYRAPVFYRFLRVRMTAYTSGTAQATLELYTQVPMPHTMGVSAAQNGSWLTGIQPAKLAVATFQSQNTTPSLDTSFGTVTNHASKASQGNVFSIHASSINSALVWFQIFNKASAPTSPGEVPIYSFPLPAGSATVPGVLAVSENFFGIAGKNFGTGIAWGISSTQATFTDAGTASNYGVHVHFV